MRTDHEYHPGSGSELVEFDVPPGDELLDGIDPSSDLPLFLGLSPSSALSLLRLSKLTTITLHSPPHHPYTLSLISLFPSFSSSSSSSSPHDIQQLSHEQYPQTLPAPALASEICSAFDRPTGTSFSLYCCSGDRLTWTSCERLVANGGRWVRELNMQRVLGRMVRASKGKDGPGDLSREEGIRVVVRFGEGDGRRDVEGEREKVVVRREVQETGSGRVVRGDEKEEEEEGSRREICSIPRKRDRSPRSRSRSSSPASKSPPQQPPLEDSQVTPPGTSLRATRTSKDDILESPPPEPYYSHPHPGHPHHHRDHQDPKRQKTASTHSSSTTFSLSTATASTTATTISNNEVQIHPSSTEAIIARERTPGLGTQTTHHGKISSKRDVHIAKGQSNGGGSARGNSLNGGGGSGSASGMQKRPVGGYKLDELRERSMRNMKELEDMMTM